MLRRGTLLFAVASALALSGCGIDWQRTGKVVEETAAELRREHGVARPDVECIRRELYGAVWECRAETARREFDCEVKTSPPRKKILSIECEEEPRAREPAPAGE